jgi:plastocyanin
MDKRLIVALAIIVLLAVAGGVYTVAKNKPVSSTSSNQTGSSTGPMSNMPSNSNANNGSQAPTATDKVTVQNFAFSPANITITKGTTVTWTNNDSVAHTIVETDGKSGPNSSSVNPGSSFTFTYSQAGTYQYHCSIHPQMTGTVTVTD